MNRSDLATDELAGLRHTALLSPLPDAAARAAAAQTLVHRAGGHLPLLVVADLIRALTEPDVTPRPGGSALSHWDAWQAYVAALRASHAAALTRQLRLPAGAAAALAVHLLQPILSAWPPASDPARLGVQVDPGAQTDPSDAPRSAGLSAAGAAELGALFGLVRTHALRLATHRERLDLDTLRLLAMTEASALQAPTAETLTAWLQLLEQPEVHDVVNFALALLPSVLDAGVHSTTQDFAVNGYAGITREGTLTDLALTELAYDDEMFLQRFLERELFYNARERTRDREPEQHLILIDGTASMRGLRAAFARGLALSLIQQHTQARRAVEVAFFDSAMQPPVRVKAGDRATVSVLAFDSPRGRDYPAAFAEVTRYARNLELRRETRLVVTFITHARCYVPVDLMVELTALAEVRGVFLLATTGALPEYAQRLHRALVVDESALGDQTRRLEAGRTVLAAMPPRAAS